MWNPLLCHENYGLFCLYLSKQQILQTESKENTPYMRAVFSFLVFNICRTLVLNFTNNQYWENKKINQESIRSIEDQRKTNLLTKIPWLCDIHTYQVVDDRSSRSKGQLHLYIDLLRSINEFCLEPIFNRVHKQVL